MEVLLAAAAAALALAAAADLWAARGEQAQHRLTRRLRRLRVPDRIGSILGAAREEGLRRRLRRAGLEERIGPRAVIAIRAATAVAALPAAFALAPAAPGRFGPLVLIGIPIGASFAPDLMIERLASIRARQIATALPDTLELMAVGAGAGRGAPALIADAAELASGPLREELSGVHAEMECGRPQVEALRDLRNGVGGELARLAASLERSRRLGSPLARGLQEQAIVLREEQARRIAEDAARAAPKIQLIVALLLVPSVLLIVGAAILANADALLVGF